MATVLLPVTERACSERSEHRGSVIFWCHKKRAKKKHLEKEGGKVERSQKSTVKAKETTRKKLVKKSRTQKQAFGLNKDVTIHL